LSPDSRRVFSVIGKLESTRNKSPTVNAKTCTNNKNHHQTKNKGGDHATIC
jgi:hypothetical protein